MVLRRERGEHFLQVLLPKDIQFGVYLSDLGADGVGDIVSGIGYALRCVGWLVGWLVGTIMFLMVKSSDFTGCKQRFTFQAA